MSWTDKTLAEIFARKPAAANSHRTVRRAVRPGRRLTSSAVMDWFRLPATVAAVNALVVLGSLGVVTWAAAAAAGYRVFCSRREGTDERIWTQFWSTFRQGLRVSMAASGGLTLVLVAVVANLVFLHGRAELAAFPLYVFNVGLVMLWLWTSAAVVRLLASGGYTSAVRLITSAARDVVRPGLWHVTVGGAVTAAVALILIFPLFGAFFSVGLALYTCCLFDRSPVLTRIPTTSIGGRLD